MNYVMLQNSDSDFGVIKLTSRKNNLMYASQDYYESIKTCRKSNKFILVLTKIRLKDFFYKTSGRNNK